MKQILKKNYHIQFERLLNFNHKINNQNVLFKNYSFKNKKFLLFSLIGFIGYSIDDEKYKQKQQLINKEEEDF